MELRKRKDRGINRAGRLLNKVIVVCRVKVEDDLGSSGVARHFVWGGKDQNFPTDYKTLRKFSKDCTKFWETLRKFSELCTNFLEIWVQIFWKFEYKFFGNLSTNFLEIWVQIFWKFEYKFFGNLSTNFLEIWVQIFWKFEYKFFGNLSTNFSEIWVQIFLVQFFGNLSTNFSEIWVQIFRKFEYKFFGNLSTNFSEIWVQIFRKFDYSFRKICILKVIINLKNQFWLLILLYKLIIQVPKISDRGFWGFVGGRSPPGPLSSYATAWKVCFKEQVRQSIMWSGDNEKGAVNEDMFNWNLDFAMVTKQQGEWIHRPQLTHTGTPSIYPNTQTDHCNSWEDKRPKCNLLWHLTKRWQILRRSRFRWTHYLFLYPGCNLHKSN